MSHKQQTTLKDSEPQTIAVFDFDGTITIYHSFWRFVMNNTGLLKKLSGSFLIVKLLWDIKVGKKPLMEAREEFVRFYLTGINGNDWRKNAEEFANNTLPAWVNAEALKKIKWHKSQGHTLALVSNSPMDYLVPWSKMYGFDFVAGSEFAEKNGVLTGEMQGNHCFGAEKVRQTEKIINDRNNATVYAYGDSLGDKELLLFADYAFYKNFEEVGNLPW